MRPRSQPADVTSAYRARAHEYADALGAMDRVADADRMRIEAWAARVHGRILDLGCGPGHWTAHLASLGHEVLGIDPVQEFVDIARARHGGVEYLQGELADLAATSGRYGGILSWYSLIHTPPHEVPHALRLLHGALRPGGRLLLGFFESPRIEPFDHAVTPAWSWPVPEISAACEETGYAVVDTERRTDPGDRPHASISARRR